MKNTENNIRISIKKNWANNKSPEFLLFPKNYNIIKTTKEEDLIEWKWSSGEQPKKITIQFVNKDPRDTKVVNGKVVEDLSILIEDIVVGGISLATIKDKFGIYKTEEGKILKTYGYMGFNGMYTFKFRYNPLYMKTLCFMLK